MHIERISQMFPVQEHIGNGIQPVEMQQDSVLIQNILRAVKLHGIFIIIFHQLQGFILVILPERILHPAVSQQISVNAARHCGRQPFHFPKTAHLPARM